ncbi:MAG: hypothetical protein PHT77_01385 [Bacteroidales bacterium]|nr:hypothetical protein [Bacteroidales bacterium]
MDMNERLLSILLDESTKKRAIDLFNSSRLNDAIIAADNETLLGRLHRTELGVNMEVQVKLNKGIFGTVFFEPIGYYSFRAGKVETYIIGEERSRLFEKLERGNAVPSNAMKLSYLDNAIITAYTLDALQIVKDIFHQRELNRSTPKYWNIELYDKFASFDSIDIEFLMSENYEVQVFLPDSYNNSNALASFLYENSQVVVCYTAPYQYKQIQMQKQGLLSSFRYNTSD